MQGTKELNEVLIGVNELAIFLVTRLKDGIDMNDAAAIFSKITADSEFKSKMDAALEGLSHVDEEIKDIDLNEAIDLVKLQLGYVSRLIAAVGKQPEVVHPVKKV